MTRNFLHSISGNDDLNKLFNILLFSVTHFSETGTQSHLWSIWPSGVKFFWPTISQLEIRGKGLAKNT